MESNYYTLKGYKIRSNNLITDAMEDYLEMIYRMKKKDIQVKELSLLLNVKPSSVSKMLNRLKELDLIIFEKYGYVNLTKKGKNIGKYLLYRHDVLKDFFKFINKEEYHLSQVEKIEHFIDYKTIKNINSFLKNHK